MLARRLGREPHCALMPASRMTFAHFAASVLKYAAHSSGELPTGTKPGGAIRSFMSGSAMVLTISPWSSAMIFFGRSGWNDYGKPYLALDVWIPSVRHCWHVG